MGLTLMVDPIKSPRDKRLYRRLKLDNELDVLLISDPEMHHSSRRNESCSLTTSPDCSCDCDTDLEEVCPVSLSCLGTA
jgi:hypothetical protein